MAKRTQFYAVASDAEGNSLEDITITVYNVGTVVEATIYSARVGGSSSPSEFDTDSTGIVEFWADPGSYDVLFHDATIPSRISDYTVNFNAISGDAAGVDGAQIEAGGITDTELAANSVGYDESAAPTFITGTVASDVWMIDNYPTFYSGVSITLNQGTGTYMIFGSIELANDISVANARLNMFSRLLYFGTGVVEMKSSRVAVAGSGAGVSVTHSYCQVLNVDNNSAMILQGACDVGNVSRIESDRGFLKSYRIA